MAKANERMLWFRFARMLCRIFCRLFLRLRVYNKENVPKQGAFLLVCNHQSFFDPVICGIRLKRPLFFLARDTLFKGLFGKLISSVNSIPVRRDEADLGAIKKIISKLKAGYGVCLFPEGTRTKDGKISPFKPGLGLLCRRGGATVVPVLVDGAFECWPRDKKLFSPWSKISVVYGEAITAEQVKQMGDKQFAEKLTNTLRQIQKDCREKNGKTPLDYSG